MLLLGIESSCDETSAAIVEDGKNIISNVVVSQIKDHAMFCGVVPEIASRMHLERINEVIDEAFKTAQLKFKDIDAVGIVYKPGLIGSLLVGLSTAKVFAFQFNVPLVPVNHIEAHLYAPHFEHNIPFPNIGLVVSGGHTLITKSKSFIEHEIIGSTIDDAVGEAFDKIAKFYNLGYPGGPIIDQKAKKGDENSFSFPKAKFKGQNPYQFSYSGLKTAVIYQQNKFLKKNHENNLENILASFQKTAIETLIETVIRASNDFKINNVVITGGVSCNSYLRNRFTQIHEIHSHFASPKLCIDNAAMVGGLAYHLLKAGITADLSLNALSKIVRKGVSLNLF
ncbi:MAG: tRNA (adenosine(37)-N6)-threonylcarbamoyltransferase complex transferase subunit TsaD [Spirochaetota bacterium]|nr:tRNA (adenosine(37)-N6)-threonylcarbamoyltransferase complex transferase subunit TsaD [Spirochaetota bacterium]